MPSEPKYTITNKIVNNLTEIARGREIIEQAKLIPKWELKLKGVQFGQPILTLRRTKFY